MKFPRESSNGVIPGTRAVMAVMALGLVLGGCSQVADQLGVSKRAPDEFSVVSKAPLILPPDYTLRPPRPGAPRPTAVTPENVARAATFGTPAKTTSANASPAARAQAALAEAGRASASKSTGELAMLERAGAKDDQSEIRKVIRLETTAVIEKNNTFAKKILFWQKTDVEKGDSINASREAARLKKAAAEGTPASSVQKPVIRRKKQTLLRGLL